MTPIEQLRLAISSRRLILSQLRRRHAEHPSYVHTTACAARKAAARHSKREHEMIRVAAELEHLESGLATLGYEIHMTGAPARSALVPIVQSVVLNPIR